jgi:hypothetical protein
VNAEKVGDEVEEIAGREFLVEREEVLDSLAVACDGLYPFAAGLQPPSSRDTISLSKRMASRSSSKSRNVHWASYPFGYSARMLTEQGASGQVFSSFWT